MTDLSAFAVREVSAELEGRPGFRGELTATLQEITEALTEDPPGVLFIVVRMVASLTSKVAT
jgi:hypothetical protein